MKDETYVSSIDSIQFTKCQIFLFLVEFLAIFMFRNMQHYKREIELLISHGMTDYSYSDIMYIKLLSRLILPDVCMYVSIHTYINLRVCVNDILSIIIHLLYIPFNEIISKLQRLYCCIVRTRYFLFGRLEQKDPRLTRLYVRDNAN